MAIIQKIRDKYAAVVIVIIAISLTGFILMDAFVGRGRGMGRNTGDVGKVNGEKIGHEEFEAKVNMQQALYGQQQQAPPREQLISTAWQQMLDEMVMKQEYEKLGLKFTAKELNDNLFGANPPQWLTKEFSDPATGQFDVNRAKQYFAQIKKQKNNPNVEMINEAYINPTIAQGLRTKYMSLLSNTAYVPKWLAEKSLAEQSEIARFSYVSVPYTSVTDTTIKVTDDDVKTYMNRHKEMFRQDEATRSVSYVAFNASPSGSDSSKVFSSMDNMKNDFAATKDTETYLIKAGSETPFMNGYTLGSKMQVPNADTIKKLANGQVFGPYLDGTKFTLAKMIDRRMMPDSVKVRHILVKFGDKALPDSVAKQRIDSIAAAAQSGADFNALVLKYTDDPGSKEKKGEYEFASSQFSGLSREFAEVAFYGKTGDKKVVKVENSSYTGYHYIEVMEQKKFETGYKVAYLSKSIDASQETINGANAKAAQFAAQSRNKDEFEKNAAKQNLQILTAPDLKQNDYQVSGLGESRAFVRWVFDNKAGDVSEPQEIADKYVVALITSASDKDEMSIAKARQSAEPAILNEKKAKKILEKLKGTTIEQMAQAAGVSVLHADSVSFAQPFIPSIGNEPKVVGAAFNKSMVNKVTEPIAGSTGVFVLKTEGTAALPNTTMNVEDLRKQMESQQKQRGYQALEALKKAADVKDNRFAFY